MEYDLTLFEKGLERAWNCSVPGAEEAVYHLFMSTL